MFNCFLHHLDHDLGSVRLRSRTRIGDILWQKFHNLTPRPRYRLVSVCVEFQYLILSVLLLNRLLRSYTPSCGSSTSVVVVVTDLTCFGSCTVHEWFIPTLSLTFKSRPRHPHCIGDSSSPHGQSVLGGLLNKTRQRKCLIDLICMWRTHVRGKIFVFRD